MPRLYSLLSPPPFPSPDRTAAPPPPLSPLIPAPAVLPNEPCTAEDRPQDPFLPFSPCSASPSPFGPPPFPRSYCYLGRSWVSHGLQQKMSPGPISSCTTPPPPLVPLPGLPPGEPRTAADPPVQPRGRRLMRKWRRSHYGTQRRWGHYPMAAGGESKGGRQMCSLREWLRHGRGGRPARLQGCKAAT